MYNVMNIEWLVSTLKPMIGFYFKALMLVEYGVVGVVGLEESPRWHVLSQKVASNLKPLGWLLLVQSLNDSFYSLKPSGWFLLKSSTVSFYFKPCF